MAEAQGSFASRFYKIRRTLEKNQGEKE